MKINVTEKTDLELDIRKSELQIADNRLQHEYGEDWLTYRDDRLEELDNATE